MKKFVGLIGVLLLGTLLMIGCGKAEEQENAATKVNEKQEELTLYIVSHGKTMLNTTDRVQGWSDAVLTKQGEEVIQAAGVCLKDINFQNAYTYSIKENEKSSDDLTVTTDYRLNEFNFGTYEGDLNHTM